MRRKTTRFFYRLQTTKVAALCSAVASQTTRLRDNETTRQQVAGALCSAVASQTTRQQDNKTTSGWHNIKQKGIESIKGIKETFHNSVVP